MEAKIKTRLSANFAKLWTSNAISTIGDGAVLAAGPLLVASRTNNPALVAAAVFAQQLPWLLFSLLSGVWVDRIDRRHALIFADILRATAIGGLALAVGANGAPLAVIYGALFLLGTGDTLADNGAVALLPNMVATEQLEAANARLQGANVIGKQLLGPPLGAYLFVVAAALPFGLDAATFLVAALLITRIRTPIHAPERHVRKSIWQEAKQGISWLWRMPLLRAVALSIGIMNITFMAAFSSFVLYVHERLGLGAVGYGVLLSVTALGGIIGMQIAPALRQRFSITLLLRAGLVIESLIDISFTMTRSPWVAGVIYAIFGIHSVIWGVITTSLRQRATPPELLGRVNSVYNLFRMGGLAIGALLGGIVASAYGITAPFLLAGIVMTIWTIYIWRQLAIRSDISNKNI